MKKYILALLLAPISLFGQTPETSKGIQFDGSNFEGLLARAKKENKLIFIDAYTTWCGPCKWMAKNVFPNDTAAIFYNQNFINAKIDMEKGEGPKLAKQYEVGCYPTYLFINGEGELVHRVSSSMPVREFVRMGGEAMNPEKQYRTFKKKYESGKATSDELAMYVLAKGSSCLSVKEEAARYFSTQKESDLGSERNWSILQVSSMGMEPSDREFKYVVKNREELEKRFGAEEVGYLIKDVFSMSLDRLVKKQDSVAFGKLKSEIRAMNLPYSEMIVLSADMSYHQAAKNWSRYAVAAEAYVTQFGLDNAGLLNNIAWKFYEKVDDKTALDKAAEWSRRSVELKPGYASYDTYAAVLFKAGRKAEAKAAAEKAIELAKLSGEDYKETQDLLDKIIALK